MNEMSENIQNILKYTTEEEPMNVRLLAALLGIAESGSCPRTRKHILWALEEGVPIASNSDGYFMLQNAKQAQVYMNKLTSRMIAIAGRIEKVYNAARGSGLF